MVKKLCIIALAMFIGFSFVYAGGNEEADGGSDTLVLYSPPHKEILIELVVDMYEADAGRMWKLLLREQASSLRA